MMNGGNIITLQRILGHANINQTMVYAHFAPDFLQDAISFNPLRGKAGLECPHLSIVVSFTAAYTAYNSLIYSDRVVNTGKINIKKGTFLCLLFFEIL